MATTLTAPDLAVEKNFTRQQHSYLVFPPALAAISDVVYE